ncbi:hypothetical protein FGB62_19g119 [Gracilaria domingensis]|nr:hypothetical protein FGB62_19g119 [Gracilaria domingensis]
MRPRQSIDIGAFQFQRTNKRRTSALSASFKSSLPPPIPPLRERTNLLPTVQRVIEKPCQAPRPRPSTAKSTRASSVTGARVLREPLHKQIDVSLSQAQRAVKLVEMALEKQLEANYAGKPSDERVEVERTKTQIIERVNNFVEQCNASVHDEWKPNPEQTEIENRAHQMEALEQACQEELEAWDKIAPQTSQQTEWPVSAERATEQSQPNELDVNQILSQSAQVFESYILQARHMLSTANRLKGINLETHYRVQVIAAALNDKILSQFSGRPSEVLKPPDTLHVSTANDNRSPGL